MLIHLPWGRHHIDCLDSRAFADESGARCRCAPGYAPPEPCQIGDRSCGCYSCKSEYSEHHRSLDGQKCTACPKGETADEAGVHCAVRLQRHCFGCFLPRHLLFAQNSVVVWSQCLAGHYNSTEIGVITCTHEQFVRGPLLHPNTIFHISPMHCLPLLHKHYLFSALSKHCLCTSLLKHCISLFPKHCISVLRPNTVFQCSNQTLPIIAPPKHCLSLLHPKSTFHCYIQTLSFTAPPKHCIYTYSNTAFHRHPKNFIFMLHPNTVFRYSIQTMTFTAPPKHCLSLLYPSTSSLSPFTVSPLSSPFPWPSVSFPCPSTVSPCLPTKFSASKRSLSLLHPNTAFQCSTQTLPFTAS